MLAESHALLVLLQVKLLVVVTWAARNDPVRLQLGSTGNSSVSYGSYGKDWAAICHQAMHTVIVTKHKMAEVGHVAEALVAAKALDCPIPSDMLDVVVHMLKENDRFYAQHLTEEHKGTWRTILTDSRLKSGGS